MTAKKLRVSAILSFVAIFTNFVCQLLLTPMLTRKLGANEYGIYSVVSSVMYYLLLLHTGLSVAYNRFYFQYLKQDDSTKIKQLNGLYLLFFVLISFFAMGFVLVLSFKPVLLLGHTLTASEISLSSKMLSMMAIISGINIFSAPFHIIIIANEKFIFNKVLLILFHLGQLSLGCLALQLGFGSIGVMSGIALVNMASLMCVIFYCLRVIKVKFALSGVSRGFVFPILAFAAWIFLQRILNVFNAQFDKILVVMFHGTEQAGIYSIGVLLSNVFIYIGNAIAELYVPTVNRIVADNHHDMNKKLTGILITTGRLQFIGIIFFFSAFIFFGQAFIQFYVGQFYGEAYFVVLLLTLPAVMQMSMGLGEGIIRAKALHKRLIGIYLVSSISMIFVRIPLCKAYGNIGAAFGTGIGLMISNVIISFVYFSKVGKLDMLKWVKEILSFVPSLIAPAFIGIIILMYIDISRIYSFIVCAFIYTLIFAVNMWFFGINDKERTFFTKSFNNMIGKV